jgi:hypothetical protein
MRLSSSWKLKRDELILCKCIGNTGSVFFMDILIWQKILLKTAHVQENSIIVSKEVFSLVKI